MSHPPTQTRQQRRAQIRREIFRILDPQKVPRRLRRLAARSFQLPTAWMKPLSELTEATHV